jgi:hypothetical protein
MHGKLDLATLWRMKPGDLDGKYDLTDAVRYALQLMQKHGIGAQGLQDRSLITLTLGAEPEVAERAMLALWGARVIAAIGNPESLEEVVTCSR